MVIETKSKKIPKGSAKEQLLVELKKLGKNYAHTANIETFHFIKSMPVDVRHNIKIDRTRLKYQAMNGELL